MLWDVFISHASEDKAEVARPLAAALQSAGLRVWIDEAQIKIGDSLRQKLDEGLAQSRFGVVILSPSFFAKQWPKRELGALSSRPDAILPVWHRLTAPEVASYSPLLTDIFAASTSQGLQLVADKILEVAGTHLPQPHLDRSPYSSRLSISIERIRRALVVIESLGNPATWVQLEFTRPGFPKTGWIGSDSSTLVEIMHGFALPLIEYRRLGYVVKRNFSFLPPHTRLLAALLQAATDLLFNEAYVAAEPPAIPYTPRVPGWRTKRAVNPARYWWQGISEERLDAAIPFFLRPTKSETTLDPMLTSEEFLEVYRQVVASGDEKSQQAIGLAANGFYGFRPSVRPVLWRVCVGMATIYQAALGNTHFEARDGDLAELEQIYIPKEQTGFPFARPTAALHDLYEPYEHTLAAATSYLKASTLPRIRALLSAPYEDSAMI
jgi:hypothetical protein